ncbi:Conserved hypothetical protein in Ubiquinol-cytochrome C chaperone locus [Paramagnetospirillum magnetotacticum MS-1]|uniref:DUF177 domain-containing protein n=1 Tax=Paramagnetospirillum magnetotacticum MS-1 TaxID=272627 RepID=A0A0C2YVR0_PARME|nr:DUF177 domain-containing protein [Paramagnetospirillum magnetotacticum]KIL98795.1 Conserved hypothetical protein in Ubiquinol-cytochrome C chaperone locus [Paramagnetospirillum magnetotacticum MS-1]
MTEDAMPFSHPVEVDKIPARGSRLRVTPSPEEHQALADWLDVVEVSEINAEFQMAPMGKTGLFRVNGRLTARVTQTCVVTLAPVVTLVDEEISMTFGPPQGDDDMEGDEIEIDFHEVDPPDPIKDGAIDLGAVMVEHLALGIDPFPRAEGAEFAPLAEPPEAPEPKANPFAALASLKQKR